MATQRVIQDIMHVQYVVPLEEHNCTPFHLVTFSGSYLFLVCFQCLCLHHAHDGLSL